MPANLQTVFLTDTAVAGMVLVFGLHANIFPMPTLCTLLFVLALVFALVAWVRCSTDEYLRNAVTRPAPAI